MLLNIYNEQRPADGPVRLTLRESCGNIELIVVDDVGTELWEILTICCTSNDVLVHQGLPTSLGFKLDTQARIKIRKG